MTRPLSRRSVLKSLGVSIGLPALEAMMPLRALAGGSAKPPPRLAFIYVPMGVNMENWTPKSEGAGFELSPTLEPLHAVRDSVSVLSGLDLRREDSAGNPHPRGSATFLSTAPVGKLDAAGFSTDVSVDQLAARSVGQETRLPSLELGCQRGIGKHSSNISWRAPGSPMGKEVNPRAVFLRLFGDPKGDVCRRSVLDLVLAQARQLRSDLGSADRVKVEEYFDSVRSIERQIQAVERDREKHGAPVFEMPPGMPDDAQIIREPRPGYLSYSDHLRLMTDLLVLAFQADVTRVGTIMFGLENGSGMGVSFRDAGVREDHHGLTHFSDGTRAECLEKIGRVDRFYAGHLAHLLEKMASIREGNGTLLDNSLVVYGSGIAWGNKHNWDNVPILLCGKGGGSVASGRHLRYSSGDEAGPNGKSSRRGTPLANLWLSLLDRMGVKVDRVADSDGRLSNLS